MQVKRTAAKVEVLPKISSAHSAMYAARVIGKGKLPKTFELEFYDGARAPMTWPFLDTKLDKKNQAAFLSGARWGDGQQVIFVVDVHCTWDGVLPGAHYSDEEGDID